MMMGETAVGMPWREIKKREQDGSLALFFI
jgi:hypothetical protein